MLPTVTASARDVLEESTGWLAQVLPNQVLERQTAFPLSPSEPVRAKADFRWAADSALQWRAVAVDAPPGSLRAVTAGVYRQLLASLGKRQLYRVWNFVPRINQDESGLEAYQQFSFARSIAFEEAYSVESEARMPAASAVGTPGNQLIVLAFSGLAKPGYFENPAQVPAYRYPEQYGPRAPSFARATAVTDGKIDWVFISGTAAIRGASSLFPDNCLQQAVLTVENLRLIAAESGRCLDAIHSGARRFFRVYLRDVADYPVIRSYLGEALFREGDDVEFLQAEICRADLAVEIEATLNLPAADC